MLNRIDTERLQAMLDYANSRAQDDDRTHRAEIRRELAYLEQCAILRAITEPWED